MFTWFTWFNSGSISTLLQRYWHKYVIHVSVVYLGHLKFSYLNFLILLEKFLNALCISDCFVLSPLVRVLVTNANYLTLVFSSKLGWAFQVSHYGPSHSAN